METHCISASLGINHLFQSWAELPQHSCWSPFSCEALKSTYQLKLQVTDLYLCPRRLDSIDFKSINYTFGWKLYLQYALSKGNFFRKQKSLDMSSNVFDLPVVSIFSPLMERSFPTLFPFSASFLLSTLMRSVHLRANRHPSRDDTEMNSIFSGEGEGLAEVNCKKTIWIHSQPHFWRPLAQDTTHPWASQTPDQHLQTEFGLQQVSVGLRCVSIHSAFSLNA